MTQNQLHELLETDSARTLVEGAEERGFIELADFEAFTLEHDLNDDEIELLTRELETIGLDVGPPGGARKENAAEPQVSLEAILQRDQPQLAQPIGLGRSDVAVSELLERLSPPQPQRLPQHRPCGPRPVVGKGTASLGG